MRVVFLAEVEGSGHIGEIKEVASGFARNYLLPRKLAAPATPDAVRRAEARAAAEARQQAKLDEEARILLEKLGVASITIQARVGERGRLYGSVTAADIAEEVSRVGGMEIDRHLVQLEEPIKQLGTYAVPLKITRNVEAALQVEVISTEGETTAETAASTTAADVAEASAEAETQAETEAEAQAEGGIESPAAGEEAEDQQEEEEEQ